MTKRLKEIDFLYTLGTILVIFGHSHSSDWTRIAGTPYEYINNFIYTFHMPLYLRVLADELRKDNEDWLWKMAR